MRLHRSHGKGACPDDFSDDFINVFRQGIRMSFTGIESCLTIGYAFSSVVGEYLS